MLMVMSGSHNLDKVFEQDQIKFPSQYSLYSSISLIESLFSLEFQNFPMNFFEYHDPISQWIEESYLEIFVANNTFQNFFMFAKNDKNNESIFARIFQYLCDHHPNQ